MKKILTCVLAAAMLLSFVACGSDTQEATNPPPPTEEATPTPELLTAPESAPTDLSSEAVYNAVQALGEVEDSLSFDEYRWSCRR